MKAMSKIMHSKFYIIRRISKNNIHYIFAFLNFLVYGVNRSVFLSQFHSHLIHISILEFVAIVIVFKCAQNFLAVEE